MSVDDREKASTSMAWAYSVPAAAFVENELLLPPGGEMELCVKLSSASLSPSIVKISIGANSMPHFPGFTEDTLVFQPGQTERCLRIPVSFVYQSNTYQFTLSELANVSCTYGNEVKVGVEKELWTAPFAEPLHCTQGIMNFEGYSLGAGNYYSQVTLLGGAPMQECDPLPIIHNNGGGNSPDIMAEPGVTPINSVVLMAGNLVFPTTIPTIGRSNPESIIVPLCNPLLPGCDYTVRLRYRRVTEGTSENGFLQIYGTNLYPCDIPFPADCAAPPVIGGYQCIEPGVEVNMNVWQQYELVVNQASLIEPIRFLVIANNTLVYGPPSAMGHVGAAIYVDDIEIIRDCDFFACPCEEMPASTNVNINANSDYYSSVAVSQLIEDMVLPPNTDVLSNRCVAISGRLIVDVNYRFENCNIVMQMGAEIEVEEDIRLELASTQILGCNNMWRGIRLKKGSELDVSSNSEISDARYAIWAAYKSKIWITDSEFRRNFISLYSLQNSSESFDLQAFHGNIFNGADPLLPPYPEQGTAYGLRPFAGVDVSNQSLLHIGVAGAQPNRFLHLRNGIITNNTNTFVRNSTFEGILRTNTEPNYPFTGFAVRHTGSAAHALSLQGLGMNAAATFHNCTEGVWATGTDVDVQEARMTGMSTGVTVQQAAGRVVEVYNNNISATARGIQVLQSPQAARISIRGNEVTTGLAPPMQSRAIAIRADGSSALQGAGIRNNEVATLGSDLGISLNACAGFEVDDNEVDVLSADNAQGILMAGGTDNILSNNTVTGLLGTGNGLWLNGAGNIRLWCNTLSKLGMGLQLSGQHSGADIATTLFRTPMGTGLRYANGVLAPQQNGRGNRWEGTAQDYSVAAARHEGGSEQVILNNQYRVHEGYNPNLNFNFFPPSIVLPDPNVDPSTPWFEVDEEVGVETCIDQPQFQEEEEVVLLRRKIAQDSIASFAIGVQWDANMQLYLKLLQEPELLNQDTLWADFFARYNQTALGQLADLEKAKFALFAPSEESEQIALWKKDMKDWVAEVLVIDSFAAADSLYVIPAQRGVLLEDIAEAVEEMSRLNDAIKDRRMTLADSLLTQNAVITAIDDPAQNQYWTNAIYLYKLANDEFTFSSAEKETLDSIAAQCPELGGHAVFVARALRALYNDEVIEDSGDCDTATQSLRTAERTNTMQMQEIKEKVHSNVWADVRIFPNPASNSFTIAYNLTQPAEMRLYDIHGKMKVSRILPAIQAGREEIPVHQLLSGVYVVVVLTESGERFTTRLSIMR